VLHRARSEHGREVVGPLYQALGRNIFDSEPTSPPPEQGDLDLRGTESFLAPILADVGLPRHLVEALDDDSLDLEIQTETDEALALTGKDVGTPIIHFQGRRRMRSGGVGEGNREDLNLKRLVATFKSLSPRQRRFHAHARVDRDPTGDVHRLRRRVSQPVKVQFRRTTSNCNSQRSAFPQVRAGFWSG